MTLHSGSCSRELNLDHLIHAGVNKLRRFGFTNVSKDNILTDEVYSCFLLRLAATLKGKDKELDRQIDLFMESFKNESGQL